MLKRFFVKISITFVANIFFSSKLKYIFAILIATDYSQLVKMVSELEE